MEDITTAKSNCETLEKAVLQQDDFPLPRELEHLQHDDVNKLEKNLVRRLDSTLMPVVVLLFLLNILDRNNIANAKVSGLTDTLRITNAQYNTCLMIFYVGCMFQCAFSTLLIAPPVLLLILKANIFQMLLRKCLRT